METQHLVLLQKLVVLGRERGERGGRTHQKEMDQLPRATQPAGSVVLTM